MTQKSVVWVEMGNGRLRELLFGAEGKFLGKLERRRNWGDYELGYEFVTRFNERDPGDHHTSFESTQNGHRCRSSFLKRLLSALEATEVRVRLRSASGRNLASKPDVDWHAVTRRTGC
jgi:hypothetical protein